MMNCEIDKYKSEFESEEHWKLRRNFMLAHRDKFPEQRLVCLAQVFYNIEFLGCKYPEKTMKLVEELSREVAADHREQKKTKLQRTFVKASDAAGSKIKGFKQRVENIASYESTPEDVIENQSQQKLGMTVKTVRQGVDPTVSGGQYQQFVHDTLGNKFQMSYTDDGNIRGTHEVDQCITVNEIKRTCGPCGSLVIFLRSNEHPNCALFRTARQWNKTCDCKLNWHAGKWSASVLFDNFELSNCEDPDKSTAKRLAGKLALDKLMQYYYAVKIKVPFSSGNNEIVQTCGKSTTTSKEENANYVAGTNCNLKIDYTSQPLPCSSRDHDANSVANSSTDIDVPLDDDNVGLKLLKMMGWSGGGLGKNEQGISEPIKPTGLIKSRAGFGCAQQDGLNTKKRKKNGRQNNAIDDKDDDCCGDMFMVKRLIRDYKFSNDFNDLVFSSDFSKEQRSLLHKYAQRIGLKSKSYGGKSEETRHLVVSKKIDNWTIIDGLVRNVGQFFNKYELLRPGQQTTSD